MEICSNGDKSVERENKEPIRKNLPSSPKDFFFKIYGHLENLDDVKTKQNSPVEVMKDDRVQKITDDKNVDGCSDKYFNDNIIIDTGINDNYNISGRDKFDITTGCILNTKYRLPVVSSTIPGNSITATYHRQLFHHHQTHVHVEPVYSGRFVDPFTIGLSAFWARKKRKETKSRRQRTTFTNEQTQYLETEFNSNEYITRNRRYEIAENLHLTENQIKIWFQNRRAKDKRIEKAQLDQQYRYRTLAPYN